MCPAHFIPPHRGEPPEVGGSEAGSPAVASPRLPRPETPGSQALLVGPVTPVQKPTGWSAGRQRVWEDGAAQSCVPSPVYTLSTCQCMLGGPSWLCGQGHHPHTCPQPSARPSARTLSDRRSIDPVRISALPSGPSYPWEDQAPTLATGSPRLMCWAPPRSQRSGQELAQVAP